MTRVKNFVLSVFASAKKAARRQRSESSPIYALDDEPLHSGEFGAVYRAVERSTNDVVAVRTCPKKSGPGRTKIKSEIDMLRRFSHHPNIIDFVCSYETSSEIHMVTEYIYGGPLFSFLPRNGLESEQDAAEYVKDLAAALCYLHRNCVAHRDVKPQSLMLTHALGGNLKLCDFSCAKALSTEDAPMWDPCGSLAYSAPEVLQLQRTSKGSYTLQCDLFSVGVVLYFLLVGHHPFDPFGDHTREEISDNICQGVWSFNKESWYGVSHEAKSVVTGLLEPNPAKRFKAKQLASHQWARGSVPFGANRCLNERVPSKDKAIICKAPPDKFANGNEQLRRQPSRAPDQASLPSPMNEDQCEIANVNEQLRQQSSRILNQALLSPRNEDSEEFANTNEQPRHHSPRDPKQAISPSWNDGRDEFATPIEEPLLRSPRSPYQAPPSPKTKVRDEFAKVQNAIIATNEHRGQPSPPRSGGRDEFASANEQLRQQSPRSAPHSPKTKVRDEFTKVQNALVATNDHRGQPSPPRNGGRDGPASTNEQLRQRSPRSAPPSPKTKVRDEFTKVQNALVATNEHRRQPSPPPRNGGRDEFTNTNDQLRQQSPRIINQVRFSPPIEDHSEFVNTNEHLRQQSPRSPYQAPPSPRTTGRDEFAKVQNALIATHGHRQQPSSPRNGGADEFAIINEKVRRQPPRAATTSQETNKARMVLGRKKNKSDKSVASKGGRIQF